MAITDYDPIASNNTAIAGINIAEGCAPDGINNAIRAMMADLAGLVDLFYPVGSLYISTSSANPALRFPGTTWTATALGRAIVGVGDNGESTWTAGLQQGAETHTLTESEIPSHTHGKGTYQTSSDGAHTHRADVGSYNAQNVVKSGLGSTADLVAMRNGYIESAGAHTHTITGVSGSTGGDTAHNNIQPSQAFYVWERTA